jgi:hypothetical protein
LFIHISFVGKRYRAARRDARNKQYYAPISSAFAFNIRANYDDDVLLVQIRPDG